tara:strand:+ start:20976 stop:21626 length:651 start_codon:yes stop_codon:yes gene_type:complete
MANPEDANDKKLEPKPGDAVPGGVYDAPLGATTEHPMASNPPIQLMRSGFSLSPDVNKSAPKLPSDGNTFLGPNGLSERTRQSIMSQYAQKGQSIDPQQDLSQAMQDHLLNDPHLRKVLEQDGVIAGEAPSDPAWGIEGRLDERIRLGNPELWRAIQAGDEAALRRREELYPVLSVDERGGTDFLSTEMTKPGGPLKSAVPLFSAGTGTTDYYRPR